MRLISQLSSSPSLRIPSEGLIGVLFGRLLCLLTLLALFGASSARAQSNAVFVSQSVPAAMVTGAVYNVTVSMRNTGNTTWSSAGAYFIGSQNPENNATWGGARVAMPAPVEPGGQANFAFQVTAPRTPGMYNFQWRMVQEGVAWFGAYSPNVAVTVSAPAARNDAQVIGVSVPAVMTQGQRYTIAVTMKNSGNTAWPAGSAYNLGSTNPQNTMLWGVNRVALAGAVAPGQQAALSFQVTAPAAGSYTMGWGMVQENVEWFGAASGTAVKVNAASPVTMSVSRSPATMTAGQPFTVSWSSTNATSVSRLCTSTGSGFAVNDAPAINGSANGTASAAWVGYPSNCVWTARGAGGSATFNEAMVTNAAATAEVVTYIHTDGLGSPVARTDSAGRVISRTRYEPYGLTADGATPTIGFTGHVNDADTGLVYMQQRYYDPVAGRFLSIDPVTTDANTGVSFNRYAYAGSNPYKRIDPDGRAFCGSYQCEKYDSGNRAGGTDSYQSETVATAKVAATSGGAVLGTSAKPSLPIQIGDAYIDSMTILLNTLALRALQIVGSGNGPVYGTAVHTIFSGLVKATGRKDLFVEKSFSFEGLVNYGTAGAIRTDVVLGKIETQPSAIYDLKTGRARLSQARADDIRARFEGFSGPIMAIYPQLPGEEE
jgi:RHS repeat-associated protein